jgi:transglutaminase-like putative cysteine protease
MNRRAFLRANGSICAGWALSRAVPVLADTPSAGEWRTFEVVTKVELLKPNGISHIWLPAPLIRNTPYQNTISTRFTAKGGTATLSKDKQSALGIVSAKYAANAKPTLSLTSRVALKNYAVDLSSRATAAPASQTELDYFLRPSRYVPTDGIVKQTALKATAGATTDIQMARAIYEWVVKNTFRDPKVRGCGRGDIRFMLESGDMGGKCTDLNALYVGLARSVGLPARHVYGLRIAKSDRGYKMYPQAETPEGRIDPFDPDNFKYEITVKEIN